MRRPPKLVARQAAFLSTFNLLAGEIAPEWLTVWQRQPDPGFYHTETKIIPASGAEIIAALVTASAALVIGADLDDQSYVSPPVDFGNYCDDCGREDGTHDPEVEH